MADEPEPWWKRLFKTGGSGVIGDATTGIVTWILGLVGVTSLGALVAAIRQHWDAWAWSVCAATAMGTVLFFWNRHIRGIGRLSSLLAQTSAPKLTDPPASDPSDAVRMTTIRGDKMVRAFGLLASFKFECLNDRDSIPLFRCTCRVTFYGLTAATDLSPSQLSLRMFNNGPEIARLDLTVGQRCPGTVTYVGEGRWESLMSVVEKTMSGVVRDSSPWRVFPPEKELVCDVEIRVPDGQVGISHAASKIKLWFELADSINDIKRVTLYPWKTTEEPRPSFTTFT